MMNEQHLKLGLRISLQVTDKEGRYYNQPLEMQQSLDLGMMDFLEMAKILGQFYDLANQIKQQRGTSST